MKEKYLIIFLLSLMTSFSTQAQSAKNEGIAEATKTEYLLEKTKIYPNPVSNGKVYISTESSTPKEIELYDMLGKRVLTTDMNGYQRDLNVSHLKPGVYLMKITEKGNNITRKLIIK